MSSPIDLLFSNLIPIIIVVSVVIRIFLGIKKAGDRRKEQEQEPAGPVYKQDDEEEVADVWSRLRPDEDEEPDVPQTAIPQETFSRPLLTQVYEQAASPPEVSLGGPEPLIAQAQTPGEMPPASAENSSPAAAFFRRINALSPMRQAVILAEILGPPKGVD
jgi:hypothetical protein